MLDNASLTIPRAVLFDWDNTLVCSYDASSTAYKNFMKRVGAPLVTRSDMENRPVSSRQLFSELFGDNWQEMVTLYYQEFAKIHLDHVNPMQDAEKFLDILHGHNIYMAVVSNKNGQFLRQEVEHLLWEPYFSSVVGCYDLSFDKPRPEPAYHALEKGRIAPGSDVWFIGDSWVDYECAVNAGLTPIIIGETKASAVPEGAMIVQDYGKLIEVFQTLKEGVKF
jgi:phosphoglycolate phosphatase